MERRAFICGLAGSTLSEDEAAFVRAEQPCGIIVFSRNYSTNVQLRRLIDDVRTAVGDEDFLVLVDQEGGRVQRLRGAEWPDLPAAAAFEKLYRQDAHLARQAARSVSQWLAGALRCVGVNTNCAPCLDIPAAGADAVIGDRAYGDEPEIVAALGRAVVEGLLAGGVVPVVKHIPGHGRAGVDSHFALPVVDAAADDLAKRDFAPFVELSDAPAAMTAHVTYLSLDQATPASISSTVTEDVIRGTIGFDGLLMSDDVSMRALAGSIGERAKAVIDAGSDVVLHCNGVMSEMQAIADSAPVLADDALRRYRRCLEIAKKLPAPVDETALGRALRCVEAASAPVG